MENLVGMSCSSVPTSLDALPLTIRTPSVLHRIVDGLHQAISDSVMPHGEFRNDEQDQDAGIAMDHVLKSCASWDG